MASTSNSVILSADLREGETPDPLTPIERLILNLLLEKQAKSKSAVEKDKPSTSVTQVQNDQMGPESTASGDHTGHVEKEERIERPLDEQDLSEGPLDEEELDRLMKECGLNKEDTSQSDNEPGGGAEIDHRPKGATGRGGRRKSAVVAHVPRGDSEEESCDEDTENDDYGLSESDPLYAGMTVMEKMSDDQVVNFIDMYKKETRNSELDFNDFAQWISTKVQITKQTEPAPKTQGKKVVFADARGRGRGGNRGRRGQRRGRQ